MKLLADESVDCPIVLRLRADGHDVAFVAEDSPGISDRVVLSRALTDGVVLVTADKDFGELVYRDRLPHAGVLLVRLAGLDESAKCDLVSRVVAECGDDLQGAFSVATPDSLRLRRFSAQE
ncbi:MAG: DUF5615 family PIN-like protein [Gemmataceae bacterium]|nr:DUF5615 family PIN-like protein [Gemmataceae bacterium]